MKGACTSQIDPRLKVLSAEEFARAEREAAAAAEQARIARMTAADIAVERAGAAFWTRYRNERGQS